MKVRTLNNIAINEEVSVLNIDKSSELYNRFIDIGLVKGTAVKRVGKSPLGNISAYLIKGALIAIRDNDSKYINVL